LYYKFLIWTELKLRALKNKMLGRIFELKKGEVTEECRKVHMGSLIVCAPSSMVKPVQWLR
jgi:hypothetical protein